MVEKLTGNESVKKALDSRIVMEEVNSLRQVIASEMNNDEKTAFGQFFTPPSVATFMSSMFKCQSSTIRILDAGAGIGSLFTAAVTHFCQIDSPPQRIEVTAYEIDDALIEHLERAKYQCEEMCSKYDIEFIGHIKHKDFIESGISQLSNVQTLFSFGEEISYFDCAIVNPPYKKINSDWLERQMLREIGIDASNLYVGFLAIAMRLLAPSGELVAITPRSFCNGPYFKKFRENFLQEMSLRHLHVFESRTHAFIDDGVLQENIILHAVKTREKPDNVVITTSTGSEYDFLLTNTVSYDQVVNPDDKQSFIRFVQDSKSIDVARRMSQFHTTLEDLQVNVSTGKVVDFRALDYLRMMPGKNTVPLLYPLHLQNGSLKWPVDSKKPNAIVASEATKNLLVPNQHYVLVRRFSSKDEARRVVAILYEPEQFDCSFVGFENHLNYFHQNGEGLDPLLAKGLAAYLNSSLVDAYFRQFNGHTQVNATDLRNIKYPTKFQLEASGAKIVSQMLNQAEIDELLEKELFSVTENIPDTLQDEATDPLAQKIEEALSVINDLELPRAQQNERSALTLLALLNLKPTTPWTLAENPLCGITPMMDFFRKFYNKDYKPNTRETVRRQTVHQFLEAGFIVANPDRPDRPINSPKAVYQIEQGALELFQTFGTPEWGKNLRTYLASVETLKQRYAQEREMLRIPITLASGEIFTLSPGGQNVLVEKIINDFATRYTEGGKVIYVGDTDNKNAYFDTKYLHELGVAIEPHGKMPDVIIHHVKEDWLILIEAVTSHGPIDGKRKDELTRIFGDSCAGLVFVTTFLSRVAMLQYMKDIAWETDVWIAESPSHLIHFNGERLLGPHKS